MGIRLSTQNLNEDRYGRVKGSAFWHGRAWLWARDRVACRLNWCFGSQWTSSIRLGVELLRDDDRGVALRVAIPYLFYLAFFVHLPFVPYGKIGSNRETGLAVHGGMIWLYFWSDDSGWGPQRQLVLHPLDVLFGRIAYTSTPVREEDATVHMPEGEYPVHITFTRDVWKRPRWPWGRVMTRADIQCLTPIPFPGKGENSWDMGEDATFSMTCAASNVRQAVDILADSVMRDRKKYGNGYGWRPEPPRQQTA